MGRYPQRCINTDQRGVDLHLVERVDRDEDVAHVGVDLVSSVAALELLRHLVLGERWLTRDCWSPAVIRTSTSGSVQTKT